MSTRVTGEERALARAALYRLLGLAFSYPSADVVSELRAAAEVAESAAGLLEPPLVSKAEAVRAGLAGLPARVAETQYQKVFTLSFSAECPLYETAFSARHLFQQTQHQADVSGFYRAFGVRSCRERPDHLAAELEFCYLLALKQAQARMLGNREGHQIARAGHRSFLRDHLARWAPLIGQRVVVVGAGTFYEVASRLLLAFEAWEERYLRIGSVERYRNEPILIADEPGDLTCPLAEGMVGGIFEWGERNAVQV